MKERQAQTFTTANGKKGVKLVFDADRRLLVVQGVEVNNDSNLTRLTVADETEFC